MMTFQESAAELNKTIETVAPWLKQLSDAEASIRPAPGKWSKKEILGHLLDSAANNHQRFVRLQLQSYVELPGYEQDGWVRVQAYQGLPWNEIIDLWQSYNRHLAHLIRHVDSNALKHT